MVITELDKEWLQSQTRKLSALQRKLLREALRGYAMRPFHLVHGAFEPGSFELKWMMRQFEKGERRASKRAAAGLAIVLLIGRGPDCRAIGTTDRTCQSDQRQSVVRTLQTRQTPTNAPAASETTCAKRRGQALQCVSTDTKLTQISCL